VRCPTCNGHGVIDTERRDRLSRGILSSVAQDYLMPVFVMLSRNQSDVCREARRVAAGELARAGFSYKEIGFILGRDRSTIHCILHRRRVA
jgi:chromosomal replication initiation ATPase DnaA